MERPYRRLLSSSRKDAELPEEVRVVEVDPGMRDLLVLHLHHSAAVDAPLSSSGGYVRQRSLVGAAGAPANDDVTLTRWQDRLHIEVQIGKRREVELEELRCPLMPHERRWKRVRLPYRLRVQSLHEGLHIVRVPRRKALSGDVKVVLSSHGQPPPKSCEVIQFRFRLLQPEAHVHLAVHRCRDVEVLLCLVALTGLPIEPAEAEVAVGDFRAQPELRRQRERFLETRARASRIRWRNQLGLQAPPRGLPAPRMSLGRSSQAQPDLRAGLLVAAGRQVGARGDRSIVMPPRRGDPARSLESLRQTRQAPLALTEQDKGIGEMGRGPDRREEEIMFPPDRERALEEGYRGLQLTVEGVDIAEVSIGDGKTGGMMYFGRHP